MVGMRENLGVGMDLRRTKTPTVPKMLRRVVLTNLGTATTPGLFQVQSGETFCIGRAIGCGGPINPSAMDGAGGGGLFSKGAFKVTPGESLGVIVNANGDDTKVLRATTVLLWAEAGKAGGYGVNGFQIGIGGRAGVGTFRRPGKDGGTTRWNPNDGTEPLYTPNGQSNSGLMAGGDSGNDSEDTVMLNLGGIGALGNNGSNGQPDLGYPARGPSPYYPASFYAKGFGAGGVASKGTRYPHTGGLLVLEFYTGDPRNISQ